MKTSLNGCWQWFFVLTEHVVRNLTSWFQQTLWKRKYDFSEANRIIRKITKSSQKEKTAQFPAHKSGLPSNRSDSKALDNAKEVNLADTVHNVTDSSEACSQLDNIKGGLEAPVGNRSEDTISGPETSSSLVGNDNSNEFLAERTERSHSVSGAMTDGGEIRIRPEERKHVGVC